MATDPLFTDKYTIYGTKTAYQIKSWISIVNHGNWPINIV